MQPCLQNKAPRPGGGAAHQQGARERGAGGSSRPRLRLGANKPSSRASAEAVGGPSLPAWAPTQGVTSACSSLLPAWVSQRTGPPKTRADLPSSRQGKVLSRRGCHRMGPAPLTKLKGWRAGPPKPGPAQATSPPGPAFSSVIGAARPPSADQGAVPISDLQELTCEPEPRGDTGPHAALASSGAE